MLTLSIGILESDKDVVLCPIYSLACIKDVFSCNSIFGAQSSFYQDSGAFTGEISLSMLNDVSCGMLSLSLKEEIFLKQMKL